MNIQAEITQLKLFRQQLYQSFHYRADALMDLIDALSSNRTARSVVELSLNALFRREYGSVHDAIAHFFQASDPEKANEERWERERSLIWLVSSVLPEPQQRKFWLVGIDVTPLPRPFAPTLGDRTFVYQPNTIRGNKPVAIGHQYSTLVFFPEKEGRYAPPWVVPLSVCRVSSQQTPNEVGANQVEMLIEDPALPFHGQLCVQVEDSSYSVVPFLGRIAWHRDLVTVTRLRGNRTLYRQPLPVEGKRPRGHPTWYGERFSLKEPWTWGAPDEIATTTLTTRKGRTYHVHLEGWHHLLMRGTRELPMHKHPFTLIRVLVLDAHGQMVFKRAMWLIVFGQRRHELSLVEAWQAYGQRYDEEHFFRFGKQRLLMDAYQTPDVEHEENWWQIVSLAYVQLWLARSLAEAMPRRWEKHLPQCKNKVITPSFVQRDFARIIQQIGTPAKAPKPRGKSPGRAKGTRPERRERQPVIKKSRKGRKSRAKAA
jgi:hypothetical protein